MKLYWSCKEAGEECGKCPEYWRVPEGQLGGAKCLCKCHKKQLPAISDDTDLLEILKKHYEKR